MKTLWRVTDDFGNVVPIARDNEWSILQSIDETLSEKGES